MLSDNQINFFRENGYLKLTVDEIKLSDEFNLFKDNAINTLPKYEDGKELLSQRKKKVDISSDIELNFNIGKLRVSGCPLEHRVNRGKGSLDSSLDTNLLYGKRAVLSERYWDKDLVKFIESKPIIDSVKKLLHTDKLSFHNASLAASYPQNPGEDGWLHIDTPGFKKNSKEKLDDRHLVNVLIYLSDVDKQSAPTRIIPGSHKNYNKINNAVANSLKKKNLDMNYLTQAGGTWEEMVPKDFRKEIKITGKAGTVIFMNSTLLHSATSNKHQDITRYVFISNFSRREDDIFFKDYSNTKSSNKKFAKYFDDQDLVKKTFLKGISLNLRIKKTIRLYINNIKSIFLNFKKVIKNNLRLIFKSLKIGKFSNKNKSYLNIGSGTVWRNKYVYGLDFSNDSEIQIDLNKKNNLPFEDGKIKGIYTSHCMEHIQEPMVVHWLNESFRILCNGGVLRFIVPNIEDYLIAYDNKDAAYFNWIRGRHIYAHDSWLRMIVRAFAEPVVDNYTNEEIYEIYIQNTHEEFINFFIKEVNQIQNDKYLAPHTHKSAWTTKKLTKYLTDIGFNNIRIASKKDSLINHFRLKTFDETRPHMSLVIEASKPN